MAKKKPGKRSPKNKERANIAEFQTIGVRSSKEYVAWVEALADHYRTNVSGIIDRALAEWSEAQGYPTRPPRRIP